MTDNLEIFGVSYLNATGVKATDENGNVLSFVRPQGTLTITQNGTVDVSSYASAAVNVSGGTVNIETNKNATPTESAQTITPSSGYDALAQVTVGAISSTYVGSEIDRRSGSDLTSSGATVTAPAGYYEESASKSISSGSATTPSTTITANPSISVGSDGLITATTSASRNVTPTVSAGYVSSGTAGTITVSGSNTEQLTTQAATTIAPTETAQDAVAAGVYTTGKVTVGAISSTYVGSGITRRDDTDLTASGATVTVPAGYYAAQETKSISSGIATAPTSISGTAATVSTGTNTLTLTKTVSVTPRITAAGYVSAGTAGNSSVSLTANVTTKAAATYNTSTTDQTISASQYLTGAQTIKAVTVSGLSADKVLSGTTVMVGDSNDPDRIASVAGTVVIQHIYSGSSDPSSSLGVDGDIYLKVVS